MAPTSKSRKIVDSRYYPISQKPGKKPKRRGLRLTPRGKAVVLLTAAGIGFGAAKGIAKVSDSIKPKHEIVQPASQEFEQRLASHDIMSKLSQPKPPEGGRFVYLSNEISSLPREQCRVSATLLSNFNNYASSHSFIRELKNNLQRDINEYKEGRKSLTYARHAETVLTALPTAFDLCRRYSNYRGFNEQKSAQYFEMFVKRMLSESNGDWRAVSEAGAAGLNQIMPDTARLVRTSAASNPKFPFRTEILAKIPASISTGRLRELLKSDISLNCMFAIAHDYIIENEMESRRPGVFSQSNFTDMLLSGYYRGSEGALNRSGTDPYVSSVRNNPPEIR